MAISEKTLEGNWNELKGQIKEKWGKLTDDDLKNVEGNADKVVGIIQKKTGETKANIESSLDQMVSDSKSMVAKASETVQDATEQVKETVQDIAGEARDQFNAGCDLAKRTVMSRPVTSLAVVFGVGLILGMCFSRNKS